MDWGVKSTSPADVVAYGAEMEASFRAHMAE